MLPETVFAPSRPTEAEAGVLEALAAQGEVLSTSLAEYAGLLRTRLLAVDRDSGFVFIATSGDCGADGALLRQREASFFVEWGEWRISFTAAAPEPAVFRGRAAIRLGIPGSVNIGRRRMFERHAVAGGAIRCVAYSGAVTVFEAEVTDVSEGGIGLAAELAGAGIEPGVILPRCRIERTAHDPLVVDIEVRHTATTTHPDGRRRWRAGCRFLNLSPAAREAVAELVGVARA